MVFNLGVARGSVVLDVTDVERAMGRLQGVFGGGMDNLGTKMGKLSTKFIEVGSSLITLTAPLVGGFETGLKTIGEYQDAMAEIKARANLTTGEFELLRTKVLEIGRDTMFSATQGAQGFLQLLAAGESFGDSMQIIDQVVAATSASGADMGFIADSLTDIMKQFNLTASDAGNIVTSLAQAEGASSATMTDLIMGLRNSGGIAHEFGLSYKDTIAVLAMFSDHGIKASEAGTQLRSMLRFMTNDTERTDSAWEKLGANWKNADGTIKPLSEIIGLIQTGLADMSDADRLKALRDLGGAYGQLGLQALVSGDSILDFQGRAIMQADAAQLAAAKLDTWNGTLHFLQSSMENFWINTLEPFVNEALRPAVKEITNIINGIADWAAKNPETTKAIIQFVAALVAAGPILFFIGRGLALLGGLFAVLTSPLTLIAGLILLLTGGFQGLANVFNTYVKPFLEGLIADFTSGDWNNLPTLLNNLFQGIVSTARDNLQTALGNVLQNMTADQRIAFGAFIISIGLLAAALFISNIPAAITSITIALTSLYAGGFLPLIPIIAVIVGLTLMYSNNTLGLRDRVNELRETLIKWAMALTIIVGGAFIIARGLVEWFIEGLQKLAMVLTIILGGAFIIIRGIIQFFIDVITAAWTALSQLFVIGVVLASQVVNGLGTAIQSVIQFLKDFATTAEDVGSRVSTALGGLGNIIGGLTSGQFSLTDVGNAIGAEIRGSREGGYTGDGSPNEVAGFHHRREYVVPEQGALVLKGGGGDSPINVYIPPGSINPESDPYTQGQQIGKGIKEQLATRGMNQNGP